ncbi:hypothetical protein IJM16_03660 [Candidatus Saccharibacteria bacterium]|nr:hypothetical protein [Candidatus Saccharibacteria bacterium]
MATTHFIDIIGPIYQDLLKTCERRKIAVNLDIQDLAFGVSADDSVIIEKFFEVELKRAIRNCAAGDKITLSQTVTDDFYRIAVKNSGANTLSPEEKAELIEDGFEVRARFGYDTIIALKLPRH